MIMYFRSDLQDKDLANELDKFLVGILEKLDSPHPETSKKV